MSKKDKMNEETIDNPTLDSTVNNDETAHEGIPQPELTVEEVLQEDLAKEKDKFLRLFAEFENYKKRTAKERIELFKTAGQDVLQSMLPVLDDFDRALVQISKSEEKELLKGVELIHGKLLNTLKSKGLEQVEVTASVFLMQRYMKLLLKYPRLRRN